MCDYRDDAICGVHLIDTDCQSALKLALDRLKKRGRRCHAQLDAADDAPLEQAGRSEIQR